ncbi:MAG TPA: DUF542 domain-containing protein [Bryobacteraceae bacterium]|nr:DUF542 domain-containing protein [Bryobacteraceae bacterium]
MGVRTADLNVGEVAARWPAAIHVLEKYHISFCCSGNIPLSEACLARGLDPARVLAEIDANPSAGEWESIAELVDHIVREHHAYLKAQLPRIQHVLEETDGNRLPGQMEAGKPLALCFRRLKEELEARMAQQESVLFPCLRELDRSGNPEAAGSPVQRMIVTHDFAAETLAEIRRLTGSYTPPPGAGERQRELYSNLKELEMDLHRHFHLENNVLFPRVIRRISGG